jgi:hypothetical protein
MIDIELPTIVEEAKEEDQIDDSDDEQTHSLQSSIMDMESSNIVVNIK